MGRAQPLPTCRHQQLIYLIPSIPAGTTASGQAALCSLYSLGLAEGLMWKQHWWNVC